MAEFDLLRSLSATAVALPMKRSLGTIVQTIDIGTSARAIDWAVPVLQEPLRIVDGMAILPNRPGNGMRWNDEAVEKFRLE